MTVHTIHDLGGGVYVDVKRGPQPALHAVAWNVDEWGARRAACGLTGRFVPPFGHTDFPRFPKLEETNSATPPRCERCLMASATDVIKAGA